jgi:hypothetical protein
MVADIIVANSLGELAVIDDVPLRVRRTRVAANSQSDLATRYRIAPHGLAKKPGLSKKPASFALCGP